MELDSPNLDYVRIYVEFFTRLLLHTKTPSRTIVSVVSGTKLTDYQLGRAKAHFLASS